MKAARFDDIDLGFWGAIAIGDLNNDGCVEILGTVNDCHGNLLPRPEAAIGLSDLRAPAREYRDARVVDFNGDSKADLIANVYSDVADPASTALLYFGKGNGTFSKATQRQFPTIHGGYGETIVSADFDNDGDLDVFMPNYTEYAADAQNHLYKNQGNGTFIEIANAAGVANRGIDRQDPEGAQTLDINRDGFLDIYAGGQLFINNRNMTFTDRRQQYGLPLLFDEGIKFFDWNNDGQVDLLLHDPDKGPTLFQFNGHSFSRINNAFQSRYYKDSYGLNAEDVDGDGFMDVIIGGGHNPDGSNQNSTLFLKRNNKYILSALSTEPMGWSDISGFADFDGNGAMDIILRTGHFGLNDGNLHYLKNKASDSSSIKVSMFGAHGERNQQGRIVSATSSKKPGFIMTRIVDGGSGYLSNNEYQLTFPTPTADIYFIRAQYDKGIIGGWVKAGSDVKIYRDGRFIVTPGIASKNCLFNWAEKNYPSLFSPAGASTKLDPLNNYRYYKYTNSYVYVSSANNRVYYRGPNGVLQDEGDLSKWLITSKCQ